MQAKERFRMMGCEFSLAALAVGGGAAELMKGHWRLGKLATQRFGEPCSGYRTQTTHPRTARKGSEASCARQMHRQLIRLASFYHVFSERLSKTPSICASSSSGAFFSPTLLNVCSVTQYFIMGLHDVSYSVHWLGLSVTLLL